MFDFKLKVIFCFFCFFEVFEFFEVLEVELFFNMLPSYIQFY